MFCIEPPSTEKPVQENIIETKPPPINNVKPEAIKPSKTTDKAKTNKAAAPIAASSAISVIASSPKKEEKVANIPKSVAKEQKQIITKVEVVAGPSKIVGSVSKQTSGKGSKQSSQPKKQQKNQSVKSVTNVVSSKVEVKHNAPPSAVINPKFSSIVEIKSSQAEEEPAILVSNNIGEPEYDYLSRQPSEFVEETYRVINLRPSKAHAQKPKNNLKNRHQPTPPADDEEHPVGLVTTLGGTIVKDGLTTVHETSVIGTYISGKYAQVLNSNSKILHSGHKAKISPSSSHRILKTIAPTIPKNHKHHLEPTPSISDEDNNHVKTIRRQTSSGSTFKNRHRPQNNENENPEPSPSSQGKKFKNRNTSHSQRTQRYD